MDSAERKKLCEVSLIDFRYITFLQYLITAGYGECFRDPLSNRKGFIQRECFRWNNQKMILQCFMALAFVGITSSTTQPDIEGIYIYKLAFVYESMILWY